MASRKSHRLLIKATFDKPVTQAMAMAHLRQHVGDTIYIDDTGEPGAATTMVIRGVAAVRGAEPRDGIRNVTATIRLQGEPPDGKF